MAQRPYFFDLDPARLEEAVTALGLPRFRARQLLEWTYRKGVCDAQAMTNLSTADRATIAKSIIFTRGTIVREQLATDATHKLLMNWGGGPTDETECVMIPTASRRTACISSQVGCPVGCRFCASGLGGLDGNLSTGQIVEQVWRLQQCPGVGRITNVVFMGMGEPLANFDAVVAAIGTLTADWGMGISARRITVSTVGLPAQIRRLAEIDLPITLAISLHAPNDAIRRRIIPWAEFVSIDQLIEAGRYYFDRTGREITLEYILLRHVNDRPEHARELADVAKQLRSNVNLIRYNEVRGLPFDRPTADDVHRFQSLLRQAHVNAHIRASRGRDIAAACGQLRHEHITPLTTSAPRG
jgi:23S rRNA (adenine2503-C2)-methyltransferase